MIETCRRRQLCPWYYLAVVIALKRKSLQAPLMTAFLPHIIPPPLPHVA
jgi:hypothetical protein